MMKESRIYSFLCIAIAVISVLLLVTLGKSSKLEDPRILMPDAEEFNSGWYYMKDGGKVEISLPFQTSGEGMTFYHDLPASERKELVLFFGNYRQRVTVQLDGRTVYHFGDGGAYWGRAFPNIYCVVPVGVQDGTQQISIRLEGGVHSKITFLPVKVGSEGTVLTAILKEFWGVLLFSVVMIAFALIVIGTSAIMLVKRKEGLGELFLHAGMFIFIISLWVLTDEPVLQLLVGSVEAVFTLSFFCFMLIPLPMLSFVGCICGRKYRGILIFKYLLLANFLIQNLIHAAADVDYYIMLPCTHILIGGSALCLIYYLYREYRDKKAFYAKGIFGASLIFMGCISFALADFYGKQQSYSLWTRLGILVYSFVLVVLSIKKMLLMEEERAKNAVYKSLAFVDVMTGCGNRAAFEMLLRDREKEQTAGMVYLAVIDVNGLKHINDTKGHLSGDEIIKGAAFCLQEAFLGMGEVFRIGGDEFAVLFRECREEERDLRERLEKSVQEYNSLHEIPVSLACGIARGSLEKEDIDRSMEKLYRDADRLMYEEKRSAPYSRE